MKIRISQTIPLLITILGISLWYVIVLCIKEATCTLRPFAVSAAFSLFRPLWAYSLCALIPAVIAILISQRTYKKWAKIGFFWTLLSFIILALIAPEEHSWFPTGIIRSNVAWVMGGLFALISLCVFAWGMIRSGRN